MPRDGEIYLDRVGSYTAGYATIPYGVEWLRFDPESPLPELVKTVAHVVFVVDDLSAAIAGKEVLIQPNSPSDGVTVAFIVDSGAPAAFSHFDEG